MEKEATFHEDEDEMSHNYLRCVSSTLYKILEQIKRLRFQFRNLLRRSALVKPGGAPKRFDFTTTQAVNHVAKNPNVQTTAQIVQDALG